MNTDPQPCFKLKNCYKALGNKCLSWIPNPDFFHTGSMIQRSKKHWISDPGCRSATLVLTKTHQFIFSIFYAEIRIQSSSNSRAIRITKRGMVRNNVNHVGTCDRLIPVELTKNQSTFFLFIAVTQKDTVPSKPTNYKVVVRHQAKYAC